MLCIDIIQSGAGQGMPHNSIQAYKAPCKQGYHGCNLVTVCDAPATGPGLTRLIQPIGFHHFSVGAGIGGKLRRPAAHQQSYVLIFSHAKAIWGAEYYSSMHAIWTLQTAIAH